MPRFLAGVFFALVFVLAGWFIWYTHHWANSRRARCEAQKGVHVSTPHGDICIRAQKIEVQ